MRSTTTGVILRVRANSIATEIAGAPIRDRNIAGLLTGQSIDRMRGRPQMFADSTNIGAIAGMSTRMIVMFAGERN